jgi:hypothetical protein
MFFPKKRRRKRERITKLFSWAPIVRPMGLASQQSRLLSRSGKKEWNEKNIRGSPKFGR